MGGSEVWIRSMVEGGDRVDSGRMVLGTEEGRMGVRACFLLLPSTDLDGQGGDDVLRMDEGGAAQVVEAALGEDLGAGLEPDGLGELDVAVGGQQLGGDDAQGAQQGPAGMDELQLAVLGEGLGVGGQAGGVPAVVAGELAGQVGRRVGGEGACGERKQRRSLVLGERRRQGRRSRAREAGRQHPIVEASLTQPLGALGAIEDGASGGGLGDSLGGLLGLAHDGHSLAGSESEGHLCRWVEVEVRKAMGKQEGGALL